MEIVVRINCERGPQSLFVRFRGEQSGKAV